MPIETKRLAERYSHHSCCIDRSCRPFANMLEVAECYREGGKVVKRCADCK
jgi:hypothetical protein